MCAVGRLSAGLLLTAHQEMDNAFAALSASPDPQAFGGRNQGADDTAAFAANFNGTPYG